MQGETATRILKSAHALIANHGYAGFSYADISESVEITKASIHHHFPTKADLVVSVLQTHRENLTHATEALTRQVKDPLARLEAYVQHWEACIRGNKEPFCIAALLAAELPGLPEQVGFEVQRHFLELSGWIRKTLQQGVAGGSIKLKDTPENEAQTFMALVHGAMLSARALGNSKVFKTVTNSALQRLSTHKT